MYSMTDLANEIRELIDAKLLNAQPVNPEWATQEIMNAHPAITGIDREFHICCSRATVRDAVRKQAGRYKILPERHLQSDPQTVLPGFEYLQRAYLTEQDGEQVIMPLIKMSYEQKLAKMAELRKMGHGCIQHARELERYMELAA